ncbi:hypothetical protein ACFVAF_18170 [Streptomyces sp. NPDC057596]|uniref:hypothetical protein n=1 Tax=Streptomyces sp. NPDC057596 TaxID=3346178 RepID=UPI0036B71C44
MSNYRDVQSAVRVEKFRVWFAWLAGNLLMLFLASATSGVAIVSVVTKVLFAIVFLLLTVTAYRMHAALNRRADRERRAVLGDDFPG